jgi:DNA-binding transcriptional MerR regulator
MTKREKGWMTIEDLSARTGVTTRNIRAYQSRGLLPSPVSHAGARAAFYTAEHLARLRLVSRLQERGFSLAGIGDLLGAWAEGKNLDQVLGMETAIAQAEEEPSRVVSAAEARELVPEGVDPEQALPRLVAAGLLVRHESGYRVPHPKVFELGMDALAGGIPFEALLDEFVRLQGDLHGIALRFVSLFTTHILGPFLEEGMPADRLADITERMKRLRQLAVEASDVLLRRAMADEIEAAARATLPAPGDAATLGVPTPQPKIPSEPGGKKTHTGTRR